MTVSSLTKAGPVWAMLLVLCSCRTITREPWLSPGHPPLRPPAVVPAGDLELRITLSKPSFVLGEPVYVLLEARNRSRDPLEVFPDLSVSAQATTLEIGPSAAPGGVYPFLPLTLVDVVAPSLRLAPGESVGTVFPAFFGGHGWTFLTPGTYRLRVVYDHGQGPGRLRAASPFVDVVVTQDQLAAGQALIRETEDSWQAGKFMVWQGGDHLGLGIALLDSIRTTHAGTLLESYANYFLGHHWAWYGGEPVRPPDTRQALLDLGAARDADLPDLLLLWKAIDEARCHLLEGRGLVAHGILDAARPRALTHPAYVHLLAEIDRLRLITP